MTARIILLLSFLILTSVQVWAAPIKWDSAINGNDHYYDVIYSGYYIPWTTARDEASALGGYLVTITSAEEQSWLLSQFGGETIQRKWIGAEQTGGPEPAGGWEWVTDEIWSYTNWSLGQPDNYDYANYAEIYNTSGVWNDQPLTKKNTSGYIIEYNSDPDAPPVPEPITVFLLGISGLGLLRRFNR